MDKNWGTITNRDRAKQIRDFSGLQYAGKITPTDIDGMIDFGNKAFVFFELKFGNTPLHYGQRLALERLVDNILPPKHAIAFIGKHNDDVCFDIDVAKCWAVEYRTSGKWKELSHITIKEAVDKFLKAVNLEDYII